VELRVESDIRVGSRTLRIRWPSSKMGWWDSCPITTTGSIRWLTSHPDF